jgi:hypothetical protein
MSEREPAICPQCGNRLKLHKVSEDTLTCASCDYTLRKATPDLVERLKKRFHREYVGYWRTSVAAGEYTEADVERGFQRAWEQGRITKDLASIPPSIFEDCSN